MSQVTTRLYCHGLGDCNLLGIAKPTGGTFWILIDCGIHTSAKGGREAIDGVVADIFKTVAPTDGGPPRLDVIVATHEHWDHISGFLTAAPAFARFEVGEIWLGWTDDPRDAQARALDRYKGEALAALATAAVKLRADPQQGALANGIEELLGFHFGFKGERSRSARDALIAFAPDAVRYLEPGDIAPLPKGLGVTAYVLGPPRDLKMLGLRDAAKDSYGIDSGWAMAASLRNAFGVEGGDMNMDSDVASPFDESEGVPLSSLDTDAAAPTGLALFVRDHYAGPANPALLPATKPGDPDPPSRDQTWRRIDSDWLGSAADVAMQLDDRTNNTSVVLAFALAPGDDVLLFAADAQIGNWQTWDSVKFPDGTRGADLVRRTRLYKVGHHGSSNATLKGEAGKGGLEAMMHPELIAFVPTDEAMAKRVGWGAIPAPELLTRLGEKAKGGVIRSDTLGAAVWERVFDGGVAVRKRRRRTA